jgi:hypothetical protein
MKIVMPALVAGICVLASGNQILWAEYLGPSKQEHARHERVVLSEQFVLQPASAPRQTEVELGKAGGQIFEAAHGHVMAPAEHGSAGT